MMDNKMMSDTKKMTLSVAEYPALQGIKPGAKVTMNCEASVDTADDSSVTLNIDQCDVETENHADKALSDMTGQPDKPGPDQTGAADENDSF